jgi:hypothetical protein
MGSISNEKINNRGSHNENNSSFRVLEKVDEGSYHNLITLLPK